MKRSMALLAAVLVGLLGLAFRCEAAGAVAPHPVASACNQGWYVNPDEQALLPEQVPTGFLFDGPSIVHRAVTPVAVKDAPANGAFTAEVQTGVAPLFKMETTAPYSTINKTGAGKYWSSKIASGPGSQAAPVDTLAALSALAPYTADTKVYSFGVGYANDTGNKAIVKTITFGAAVFNLACVPASPSPSASASSAAPSASASASVTVAPSSSASADTELALTGSRANPWLIAGAGFGALFVGSLLYFLLRRNKVQWDAGD